MKKIIIIVAIILLAGVGYITYNVIEQSKEDKQNLSDLQEQIEALNAQLSGEQATDSSNDTAIGVDTGVLMQDQTTVAQSNTGEENIQDSPKLDTQTIAKPSLADQFIQQLRSESLSVDFQSICPYAKNQLIPYANQPEKYVIVYIDEYNQNTWATAYIYDISDKKDIETSLNTQKSVLDSASTIKSLSSDKIKALRYINNSDYFWIQTRNDDKLQYGSYGEQTILDIDKWTRYSLLEKMVSANCEEPMFYGDAADINLGLSFWDINNIKDIGVISDRRSLLNAIENYQAIHGNTMYTIKQTPYGSLSAYRGAWGHSIYFIYTTISNGEVIIIPVMFAEPGNNDYQGRLIGSVRKKNGDYPKLIQIPACYYENNCDIQNLVENYILSLISGQKESPYFNAMVESFEKAINDLYQ